MGMGRDEGLQWFCMRSGPMKMFFKDRLWRVIRVMAENEQRIAVSFIKIRLELNRLFTAGNGFGQFTPLFVSITKIVVCSVRVRFDLKRFLRIPDGFGKLAVI